MLWVGGVLEDRNDDFPELCYAANTIFPFLNAAFNPVILISQSKGLQNFVKRTLRRVICCYTTTIHQSEYSEVPEEETHM